MYQNDILNEIILAIAMYMYFSMIDQADISGSYSYIYIVESGIKHHKPQTTIHILTWL